jgi:hypothetical protein
MNQVYVALDLATGSLMAVKELTILDIPADDQRSIEQEVCCTSHLAPRTSHLSICYQFSVSLQVRALSMMQHANIVSYIGTHIDEQVV